MSIVILVVTISVMRVLVGAMRRQRLQLSGEKISMPMNVAMSSRLTEN